MATSALNCSLLTSWGTRSTNPSSCSNRVSETEASAGTCFLQVACGGEKLSGHGLTVANAQLAVSGETGKYPEFNAYVKAIDARPFWRDKSVSPSGAGYHYNHNAETYMEVGDALGRAMVALLSGRQ